MYTVNPKEFSTVSHPVNPYTITIEAFQVDVMVTIYPTIQSLNYMPMKYSYQARCCNYFNYILEKTSIYISKEIKILTETVI